MNKKKAADLIMKRYWPMMDDEQRENLFHIAEWLSKYAPQTDYNPAFSYAALYYHTGTNEDAFPVAGVSMLPFMESNVEKTYRALRATLATLEAVVNMTPKNEACTYILEGLIGNLDATIRDYICARAVAYSCANKRIPKD